MKAKKETAQIERSLRFYNDNPLFRQTATPTIILGNTEAGVDLSCRDRINQVGDIVVVVGMKDKIAKFDQFLNAIV